MKALSIFVISVLIFDVHCVKVSKTTAKILAQPCVTQEGASLNDVDDFLDAKLPANQQQKCLAACLGREYLLLTNDNKLNVEGIMLKMKETISSADMIEKAKTVATACAEVTNDDRCEAAYQISQCIKREASNKGVQMDELRDEVELVE